MENEPRLVKPAAAYELCGGISESTARRLMAAGEFPRPVVLSRDRHGRPVRVAFVHAELMEFCRRRIEADRGRGHAA